MRLPENPKYSLNARVSRDNCTKKEPQIPENSIFVTCKLAVTYQNGDDSDKNFKKLIYRSTHKNKPIIFASQLKTSTFRAWPSVSGRSDGLLDRILHPSLIIELKGESRRKEKGAKYLS